VTTHAQPGQLWLSQTADQHKETGLIAAYTNAQTIMIAEKGAAIIKGTARQRLAA
jgi:hypothetical protein